MVKPRERRIPIMFSEDELNDIDEWRFENRIATRADAVRRLCKIAILVEAELEQVVDIASDGVKILEDQSAEMFELYRQILHPRVKDVRYGQEELSDVVRLANRHSTIAEEGVEGLRFLLVAMYNAIAALVQSKTVRSGALEVERQINEANAATERANERKKEREDNRYLSVAFKSLTLAERVEYEALHEEEQKKALERQMNVLREAEERDPEDFRRRYVSSPFWEKPEWEERIGAAIHKK